MELPAHEPPVLVHHHGHAAEGRRGEAEGGGRQHGQSDSSSPSVHPQERYSPIDAGGTRGRADRRRGLSGIGAACHLRRSARASTYAILEARDAIGGTWDLFRYPGIRSDSDMFTLGYAFRPWEEARRSPTAPSILQLHPRRPRASTASSEHIRFHHRVRAAPSGRAPTRAGRSTAERTDTGETVHADVLVPVRLLRLLPLRRGLHARVRRAASASAARSCTRSTGRRTSTTTGKRVVVIGSGATAVTLVPAMAERAAHVTMLQRSPTYVVVAARPRTRSPNALRRRLPGEGGVRRRALEEHAAARWRSSS